MKYDFEVIRGDTLAFSVVIDANGDTVDPDAIRMTARRALTDTVLYEISDSGATPTGAGTITANGTTPNKWDFVVAPEATEDATPGAYDYDVEFTIDGAVNTPIYGIMRLVKDASRPAEV